MLFKRIFKSKKPVNNIGISSSKQSVQIPNIHEIALKRAFLFIMMINFPTYIVMHVVNQG